MNSQKAINTDKDQPMNIKCTRDPRLIRRRFLEKKFSIFLTHSRAYIKIIYLTIRGFYRDIIKAPMSLMNHNGGLGGGTGAETDVIKNESFELLKIQEFAHFRTYPNYRHCSS